MSKDGLRGMATLMAKIQSKDLVLASKIIVQAYFIQAEDIDGLVKVDRYMSVIVRCAACKMTCSIYELPTWIEIIANAECLSRNGNHIRDMSLNPKPLKD